MGAGRGTHGHRGASRHWWQPHPPLHHLPPLCTCAGFGKVFQAMVNLTPVAIKVQDAGRVAGRREGRQGGREESGLTISQISAPYQGGGGPERRVLPDHRHPHPLSAGGVPAPFSFTSSSPLTPPSLISCRFWTTRGCRACASSTTRCGCTGRGGLKSVAAGRDGGERRGCTALLQGGGILSLNQTFNLDL